MYVTPGQYTVYFQSATGWTTPASQQITVTNSQNTPVTTTYVQQGTLTVTINPAGAVSAGAEWSIDGGNTWYAPGPSPISLDANTYTVTFYSNVTGWNTPSSQQVTVTAGQPSSASGTYVQQTGSLAVTIGPQGTPPASSAQWTITDSNNNTWQGAGDGTPVGNIPTGSYTMTFSNVTGWNTPASQQITIISGSNTASGTYVQQFNSLTVAITPADAAAAGGQWSIDGGTTWHETGDTITHIAVTTSLTVTFKSVTDWTTPAPQQIQIANSPNQLTGVYGAPTTQPVGILQVTITPKAANTAGAYWQVDGGSWQQSEAKVTDLATGHHTVTFLPMAGWTAPGSKTITIAKGANSISAAYVELVGSLKVSISPQSAVNAGAKWSIDSGATWHSSGATLTTVPIGQYSVTFKGVTNWNLPTTDGQSVTIANGQTVVLPSTENVYVRQTGSLTVSFTDPVPAGAEWSIDGGAHWYASGAQTLNSGVDYTVTFKSVYGWDTPAPQKNVNVPYNGNQPVTGTYAQQHGSLKVTISPSSVAEGGATWQVDGGGTAEPSGATVNLTVGAHNVTFSTCSGWTAPGTKTVTINKNAPTTITGTYVK
jgi:hypothetical protein